MATTHRGARIDLTPFGYTATESLVYGALLERGASSGYGLGKALSLARANVYHALDTLVTKGAAVVANPGPPQRFQAVSPNGLLALVAGREAERLERLERQVRAASGSGTPTVIPFRGQRALEELALRTAGRDPGTVLAMAPTSVLEALAPLWRKRLAEGAPSDLWAVGATSPKLAGVKGLIRPEEVLGWFGLQVVVVAASRAAILAGIEDGSPAGYWTSDPVIVGSSRAAILHLSAASGS
jgi:sugar-specific transcriptional regulator TrmB